MGARIEGARNIHYPCAGRRAGCTAPSTPSSPDRIEAGTFLIAGAMTHGDVGDHRLRTRTPRRADRQTAAGGRRSHRGTARTRCASGVKGRLRAVDITTEEYPGFATDLQAQYMAMMTLAEGISFITETIFENRFMHTQELARMGANIRVEGRQAIVAGARRTHRRAGDRFRPARQRVAGAGGPGGARAKPSSIACITSTAAMRKSRRSWRAPGARIERVS